MIFSAPPNHFQVSWKERFPHNANIVDACGGQVQKQQPTSINITPYCFWGVLQKSRTKTFMFSGKISTAALSSVAS